MSIFHHQCETTTDVKAECSSEIAELVDKFTVLAIDVKPEDRTEISEVASLLRGLALEMKRLAEDVASIKVTVQALPVPIVMEPNEIKRCPLPTPTFTGREDVVLQMDNCFFDGTNKRHLFVIHGLGGAGKSQIVYKFVERCDERNGEDERFSEVFFIDAGSRETITADFKNIALNNGCDPTNTAVLAWFCRHRTRWLIIFDNADDPALNIRDYLPQCTHGDIIVTTRNPEVVAHARGRRPFYKVSGMLPEESSRLLVLISTRGMDDESSIPADEAQASQLLVKDLGFLALAVVQAGAYISTIQSTIAEYADLYRQRRGELLKEYRTLVQKTDDYGATVYTTWRVSFERLPTEAQQLLRVCAFVHHEGISETFFSHASDEILDFEPVIPMSDDESAAFDSARTFLTEFERNGVWDKVAFHGVILQVMSYSLLDFDKANKFVLSLAVSNDDSTVGLTHNRYYCRILITLSKGGTIKDRAARQDGAGDKEADAGGGTPLDADEHVEPYGDIPEPGLEARSRRGAPLDTDDNFEPCVDILETRPVYRGGESAADFNLGRWMMEESMQAKEMDITKRTLGEEHPNTLTSMSNLALTYSKQYRWTEAERLQVSVLETRKRVLSEEHPNTLTSMSDLASTYLHQGRLTEAERLRGRLLEVETRKAECDKE
ncbi:uncharacterized protein STEHIDRAFT_163582 [Stereum hirsutum FP-91666 SS1]|uniref:Uncharacterized protein n=1 Tax=Stereum hirsutum (strain FP-91666) TaxID=721885 RepID=R7RW89_STEHR|nr:uncharacterized protein STEHIDRAFT_163582 [Stereum hirsutum FP-91666 SS1]EIM79544.1 hypothetical protein STEHIDRAFT_163582 [Stereum hirsutum FP-91666 SS1]